MPTLVYLGQSYECSKALKGSNYIHLLDSSGHMVAAFDEISDFSKFTITGGSYTTPTTDHNCYVAVVRDDGTIGKGGHKCSGISATGHKHAAGDITSGILAVARGGTGVGNIPALLAALGNVGACRVETGYYTGTGTWGENAPNSLTFAFSPKIVFVGEIDVRFNSLNKWVMAVDAGDNAIAVVGGSTSSSGFGYDISFSFENTAVFWYAGSGVTGDYAEEQGNTSGTEYAYFALG